MYHGAFVHTGNRASVRRVAFHRSVWQVCALLQPVAVQSLDLPVPLILATETEVPQAHRTVLRCGDHELAILPIHCNARDAVPVRRDWWLVLGVTRAAFPGNQAPHASECTRQFCVSCECTR